MNDFFPAATWSLSLKLISLISTALIIGISVFAFQTIPDQSESTQLVRILAALIIPAIFFFCLLFIVRGYAIEGCELLVKRLLWSTHIPLTGLIHAQFDQEACKRTITIFGNSRFFSFSGLFYSKPLGRFRLFGTDLKQAVILKLPSRTVVITPASPELFISRLHELVPFETV